MNHTWEIPSLKEARFKRRSRIPYNKVKEILDLLKSVIRREYDDDVKKELLNAARHLNRVYMK